jgi:phenylpropionate dioxygenase-like ring-hydroxylating dioxygenase large terminal subunit
MELSRPPREHWYIAARVDEVGRRPLGRTVLAEPLVLFRDADGRPAALLDRCLHRNMALSAGRLVGGCLECPYHGWRYDRLGRCTTIPALADPQAVPALPPLRAYRAVDSDGYVWVFLGDGLPAGGPFRFPHLGEPGWTTFRMRTRFSASAFACLENFLDCPHTVFVHRGWFRTADPQPLAARVRRWSDRVEAEFVDEPRAPSLVGALFFPAGEPLVHTDRFFLPAISRVDYRFGTRRHFIITSQCTPVSDDETVVDTVITFRFGRIAPLVRLLFEPVARRILRQDVRILARQTAQLRRFGGSHFISVETDLFARHIRRLWGPARTAAPAGPADGPDVETRVGIRF